MSGEENGRTEVDLVIEAGAVVTMDAGRNIIRDGAVAISGQRIVAVGKRAAVARSHRGKRVISAPDDMVIPGLIDSHNHSVHYMTRGTLDDTSFVERQTKVAIPFQNSLTEEDTYRNAQATIIEMIANGTTCFHDCTSDHPNGIARAARELGIRAVVGGDAVDDQAGRHATPRPWQGEIEKAERTIAEIHGTANGRLRAAVGLRGTSSEKMCRAIGELAVARNVTLGSHLIISRAQAAKPEFKSPVLQYQEMGLLGPNTLLFHLGYINPAEIEIFVANGVKGVHCPARSMFGAGGFFVQGTIPDMIDAGMTIALGTDAAAISRFLDMVRQMYLAACGHKETHIDPTIMGAYKAFEMATVDGARAMLWEDEIGSLEPGKKADLVIVDMTEPEVQPNPFDCPVGNLVYSGSGRLSKTVVIDGAIVMEDRVIKTIDAAAFRTDFNAATTAKLAKENFKVKSPWPVA